MSLQEFKTRFIQDVLELIWAQWCELGVSAHVDYVSKAVVDMESLIVCSSWGARYDERLYDLILSWLIANGDVINLQRLKALARKSDFTDASSLHYMARVVVQHGGRKWAALAGEEEKLDEPKPLFLSVDGSVVSFCPRRDDMALRYGFVRTPFLDRHLVVQPDSDSVGSVAMRLRGLCGISARADLLAVLLNGEAKTAAELALSSGYTWKSTNEALKELVSSGLLQELRISSRSSACKLKDAKLMASMMSVSNVVTVNWFMIFETIGMIWRTVSNPRLEIVAQESIQGEFELLASQICTNSIFANLKPVTNEEDLCAFPRNIIEKYFM